MIQKIGKMSLRNSGQVILRISFNYFDVNGQIQRAKSSDSFTDPSTKTVDPGDDPFKVPDGSLCYMHADVQTGTDQKAQRAFTYEKGNTAIAHYVLDGSVSSLTLQLEGIGET